jgi:hypothetical protein
MRLDAAASQARSLAPSTWGAFTAVVLLLGALSLFLIGCDQLFQLDRISDHKLTNYYPCECQCTKGYESGVRISATSNATNVRATPGGTLVGQVAADALGTILTGPIDAVFMGVNETWWQVDFDDPTGPDGWVVQGRLQVLETETMIVKELNACLPAALNPNLGATAPTPGQIADDCAVRVADQFATVTGQALPPGSTCKCGAQPLPETKSWDAGCDAPCGTNPTDPNNPDVCLVPGSDPEEPTPDFLPTALFSPTSVCAVSGEAEIHVGDEVKNTNLTGVIQIYGRPCVAGQSNCQVGISYQLALDDIEFEVRFRKNPKFVNLMLSGASEPLAVNLASIGSLFVGQIPPGTSLNSVSGRKSGSPLRGLVARNAARIDVAIDWVNKTCLLNGNPGGTAVGKVTDDDQDDNPENDPQQDLRIFLTAGGPFGTHSNLVNQPPRANAGPDQTVECTSPAGAVVNLNAGASTDADSNIALYVWRRGSETGPQVANPSKSPTLTTHQAIGETTYHLRVVDDRLSADNDSVKVKIEDTTKPVIDCQAPVRIPKQDAPLAFRATATDSCGPPPTVVVESFACFKVNAGVENLANPSCKVAIQGDTVRIEKSTGVDRIRWATRATDGAGNVTQKTCQIEIDK